MSSKLTSTNPGRVDFVTTRWTEVLIARGESPEAQVALGHLCEAYWMPVFRFIRGNAFEDDSARDLTQEFFAQLLARRGLEHVEQGKGRFRSYLLGAVKHFLADQRDRAGAAKRGGGQAPTPIEMNPDTQTGIGLQLPDPAAPVADAYFDRLWALNLIDRTLKALQSEFSADDKDKQFEILKPWLVGEVALPTQAQAAKELGMSEGALKVAVHRLRKRFKELVKAEIAGTIDGTESVQTELQYLLEALTAG